jgi:hypothetical protein
MKDAFIGIVKTTLFMAVCLFLVLAMGALIFWTQRNVFCERVNNVDVGGETAWITSAKPIWACNF